MEPRLVTLSETKLIGKKMTMSFAHNRTAELWKSFMPVRHLINNLKGSELYSVEVYGTSDFFEDFDANKTFEKWAAMSVSNYHEIPENMQTLTIPKGEYAVFDYKGKPSEAQPFYQEIYTSWFPDSGFVLDNRPHFALMGTKYKGEDPDSEEEIWIPVKRKSQI